MTTFMLSYTPLDSPIHRLTGATKLLYFSIWSLIAMITFDTRILAAMLIMGITIFIMSKVSFRSVSFVFYLILIFLIINNIAIFVFSPLEGVKLYNSRTDLFHLIGPYTVTLEQLFYLTNVTLKYLTVIPLALLFLVTTHPSEFASSLNKLGVSYKIGIAISIAMRYIPDVQRDFRNIAFAQQTRGVDLSRKAKLGTRLRNVIAILLPLVLSSLERIDTISTAMELRGFGRKKTRTFYSDRPFAWQDIIALILLAIGAVMIIVITFLDGSRYWNPFQ
jgi:energy-coupling factor transport system permease protein